MQTKQAKVDEARLGAITCGPLPASRKVYLPGTLHPFLRVPMREIAQTPTQQHGLWQSKGGQSSRHRL